MLGLAERRRRGGATLKVYGVWSYFFFFFTGPYFFLALRMQAARFFLGFFLQSFTAWVYFSPRLSILMGVGFGSGGSG